MRSEIVLLLLLLGLTACASVRPWEREVLSREEMAWDPDPLDASLRSHIFFSKEAAMDGGNAGGGGCGCN
jgi:Domain of unknown function (DUF4266)